MKEKSPYTSKKFASATHCYYCEVKLQTLADIVRRVNAPNRKTIDHLIPRSKGGTDDESNLVIACRKCNEAKGVMMPYEFEILLANHTRVREYE